MRNSKVPNKLPIVTACAMFILLPLCCCGFMFGQYPVERYILMSRNRKLLAYEQRLAANPADAEAAKGILKHLTNYESHTRCSALRTLGRVDATGLDEIELIAPYLSHEDHYTRRAAILAVKDRGDEASLILDEVIACLDEPIGIDVRVFAAQVLAGLGADAAPALPALREAAGSHRNETFRDEFQRYVQEIEAAIEAQEQANSP